MRTAAVDDQCGRSPPLFCPTVRCSAFACSCPAFAPGRVRVRSCDLCGHGWVAHALQKLPAPPSSGPVEVVLPGLVFDLGALVLYRAQAVPIRLKILLDRLFSVLAPDQVSGILLSLGWSLGDYVRGYMLQGPGGGVLDRWVMVTPEEELLLFKQFLRFGETRPIVEMMRPQGLDPIDQPFGPETKSAPKSCQQGPTSRGDRLRSTQELSGLLENNNYFENVAGGPSSLLPFHSLQSQLCSSGPSIKERVPCRNLSTIVLDPFTTKPAENKQEAERVQPDQDPELRQTLKIKSDRDDLRRPQTLGPPPRGQELLLHEGTSPFTPALTPSLTRPSFSPSVPSSPSSSLQEFPLQPLPSFSSSFCPSSRSSSSSSLLPVRFLSSPLHPLPTSLCSSSAGGRKGRVHCGVCGKSFYDKGTLKIHYNAVHLKIKHRCTVAGCTMVFSSLRSRNRHSSNPNPRLHTGAHRGVHADAPSHGDAPSHADAPSHGAMNTLQERRLLTDRGFRRPSWFRGFRSRFEADCDITAALTPDDNPVFILNPAQTPPLDCPPSCSSFGQLLSDFCCGLSGQRSAGPLPKKKSRKSSMPVKIEREMTERRTLQEEEEN